MENDDNPDIEDISNIDTINANGVIQECEAEHSFEIKNVDTTGLVGEPEIERLFDQVAAVSAYKFGQDKFDVKQEILFKWWRQGGAIRYPKAWAYKTASHLGLNEVRHRAVERSYAERKTLESKESARYKGEPLVQSSAVLTPEQELLQNESYRLVERTVLDAVQQSPSWLANAWDPEKTPGEIIAETGKPPATVYRQLGEMQKRIVSALRQIGIEPL